MTIPKIQINIQWRAALVSGQPQQGYTYPDKFNEFFRRRYTGPAVYRWRIHHGRDGKPEAVYVGETDNLVQRIQRVRTPPKNGKDGQTNRRLKEEFDRAMASGKVVFLDVADFEPFELNNLLITPNSMDDKFKRCFVESLCLLTLERQGYEVGLNRRLEPISKAEKLFRNLPPAQKRRALEMARGVGDMAARD